MGRNVTRKKINGENKLKKVALEMRTQMQISQMQISQMQAQMQMEEMREDLVHRANKKEEIENQGKPMMQQANLSLDLLKFSKNQRIIDKICFLFAAVLMHCFLVRCFLVPSQV